MKLLYIAAPYRAKTIISLQQNIHEAKLMAMYYWNKDYAVLCPHSNSANFDGLLSDDKFLEGTMLMLAKCDLIAMHPNWQQSAGCLNEHNLMINTKGSGSILFPEWDEILTILDKIYLDAL